MYARADGVTVCAHSLGSVDPETVQKVEIEITDVEKQRLERFANRPPLSEILNLHDFEVCRVHTTPLVFCSFTFHHV